MSMEMTPQVDPGRLLGGLELLAGRAARVRARM